MDENLKNFSNPPVIIIGCAEKEKEGHKRDSPKLVEEKMRENLKNILPSLDINFSEYI